MVEATSRGASGGEGLEARGTVLGAMYAHQSGPGRSVAEQLRKQSEAARTVGARKGRPLVEGQAGSSSVGHWREGARMSGRWRIEHGGRGGGGGRRRLRRRSRSTVSSSPEVESKDECSTPPGQGEGER